MFVFLLLFVIKGTTEKCDLSCWLRRLTLEIPDVVLVNDLMEATLSNITCSELGFTRASSGMMSGDVSIDVVGVGVEWTAALLFREVPWPHASGRGRVTVNVSGSSAQLVAKFKQDADGFPSGAELSGCDVHVHIASVDFSGGAIADVLERLRRVIIDVAPKELGKVACAKIGALVGVNGSAVLKSVREFVIEALEEVPPVMPIPVFSGSVNLQESAVLGMITHVYDRLGLRGIKEVLRHVTNGLWSFVVRPHVVFSAVSSQANVSLTMSEVLLAGLDSLAAVGLRSEPSSVTASVCFERLYLDTTLSVEVMPAHGPSLLLAPHMRAYLSVHRLDPALQLGISEASLKLLTLEELACPGCWRRAVHALDATVAQSNVSVSNISVVIDAALGVDEVLTTIIGVLLQSYAHVLPSVLNATLRGPIADYMTSTISTHMAEPCTPHMVTSNNVDVLAVCGAAAGGVLLVVLGLASAKTVQGWSCADETLTSEHDNIDQPLIPRCRTCAPFAMDPTVPVHYRLGVPILAAAAFVCQISAHASTLASAYMVVVAEETTKSSPIFDLRLGTALHKMWEAHAYVLLLMVALFSGVWAYVKLALLILSWYHTTPQRGRILIALDTAGKLVLVLPMLITLMMIGFHPFVLYTSGEEESFLVGGFLRPRAGFWLFFAAFLLSFAAVRLALGAHRMVDCDVPVGLLVPVNLAPSQGSLAFSRAQALLLTCVAVMLCGSWAVPLFTFHYKGMAKLAMVAFEGDSDPSYSLWSLPGAISGRSFGREAAAYTLIETVYVVLVLLMPAITTLLTSLILGLSSRLPVHFASVRGVFNWMEATSALACVDVLFVASIGVLANLPQFVTVMIGDRCDVINKMLDVHFHSVMDNDVCVSVQMSFTTMSVVVVCVVGLCRGLCCYSWSCLVGTVFPSKKDSPGRTQHAIA